MASKIAQNVAQNIICQIQCRKDSPNILVKFCNVKKIVEILATLVTLDDQQLFLWLDFLHGFSFLLSPSRMKPTFFTQKKIKPTFLPGIFFLARKVD
jgi:hypothetical protein